MISKNGIIRQGISARFTVLWEKINPQIKLEYDCVVKVNIKQWKCNNAPIIRNDSCE